jgi:hypothetical protein
MADVTKLVRKLAAFQQGRAVVLASHQQIVIQPGALVICPLAMAGEDTTIHAIAVGAIGQPPSVRVVPDPRVRDDQYQLVTWFGGIIEQYYARCRATGDFPQLWTTSGGAAGHLDVLADRFRFVRDNPSVKRTGDLLTYATERAPVHGQQALMTMTGALSSHFATGQQDGEDDHLGAFLTWLDPPEGEDIHRAVARAEQDVMGVKTDPEFDRDTLQPLIKRYHQARKSGATPAQMRARAAAIEAELAPIVTRIYEATQRGFGFLLGRFPPSGQLAELASIEASSFRNFMEQRDAGNPLPYRDRPRAGAFKITEREFAVQATEAGAIYGDSVARARAQMTGEVLVGQVRDVTVTPSGRKRVHRFVVETAQTNLHTRAGDVLALLADPRMCCSIESVDRIDALSRVALRIVKGMRAVGSPTAGATVSFGPPPPDWEQFGRARSKMSDRLDVTPWTHDADAAMPAVTPRARILDPLAAIEALR